MKIFLIKSENFPSIDSYWHNWQLKLIHLNWAVQSNIFWWGTITL